MAFERLSQALGQEFLSKKKFGRETPEREARLKGLDIEQEGVLGDMFQEQRKRNAKETINKTLLQLDAMPISSIQDKMSEEHKSYLNKVSDLNDPEAMRMAENRVKFDIVTRDNPEILKAASIAFPELGAQISGITTSGASAEKQATIEKRFEEKGELSEQEHFQRLREIRKRGEANLRYLRLQTRRSGKAEPDPRLKVAQQAIQELLKQLDQPPLEGDDPTTRAQELSERLNAYTKFINDFKAGGERRKNAELPDVDVEDRERLLPDEVSNIFAPEE